MILKRVLYNEFYKENKLNIIDHLYKKYNWQPVLMFGLKPDNYSIKKINTKYSSCIIDDSMLLRQSIYDYTRLGKPVPIDKEILSSLSNHALNYLSVVNDTTGYNFSFEERKSYYFDIMKYWNTVINNLKPDIFVSYAFPHTPSCLSLYLLCKHCYNIDVLFVDPFPLLNNNSYLIGTNLEKIDDPISKIYNDDVDIILGKEGKRYLYDIRTKRNTPNHIIKQNKLLQNTSEISQRLKEFFKLILVSIKNGYGFQRNWDWKKNKKPYYDIKSRMSVFEHFLFTEILRHKNRKLKKIYKKLLNEVDYSKKYVYFASQYQPEASNSQIGSYYENFFLVLDILSESIPSDWIIYFKENPTTFSNSPLLKSSLRRDKHYYEKIAKYPNIILISSDANTFDLIDHAQAVATVTGTVAWEAIVRDVPSLAFGRTWYSGCKSIFSINSYEDAQIAITKIINGYKPDRKDIERYTASIEKIASKKIISLKNFDEELKKTNDTRTKLNEIGDLFYETYIRNYS